MSPTPRIHQLEAIAAIQAHLHTTNRVSVLMACGTGKTLVGRWLAEQRQAATTLVVVPSLALIAQTLADWRSAGGPWHFEALIICSDPTTADGAQERASSDGEDIPTPFWSHHRALVTTSKHQAARALTARSPDRPLVVFSTYHSAHVAAAAAIKAGTIGTCVEKDNVIAAVAVQAVVISAAINRVVTAAAIDRVEPSIAIDHTRLGDRAADRNRVEATFAKDGNATEARQIDAGDRRSGRNARRHFACLTGCRLHGDRLVKVIRASNEQQTLARILRIVNHLNRS